MRGTLKKSLGLLTLLSLTFMVCEKSMASHAMGADITYRCLSNLKFEITLKFYRDCRGVSFGNPSSETSVKCASGGTAIGVSLNLKSIREVTPLCKKASARCYPSNISGTGEGIEEHTYLDTIDFNSSPYSTLKSCCEVIIESGQCCRNGAINTGAANAYFYTYAMMDICKAPCNSSPTFTSPPIGLLCCGKGSYSNTGAIETVDFDSLSCSFAEPMSGYKVNIAYSGKYSYQQPMTAYWPVPLKYPYVNQYASPPIGIYLDAQTGDLIFTSTKCDEVTVVVLEFMEWRKDSLGKFDLIGITRRDMQFSTQTCPDNNAPEITNKKFTFETCIGKQICFDIVTDDKVFNPPSPLPKPPPDTVTLTWNRGIPGATFTIINKDSLHPTGRFCWTPDKKDASDIPYTFLVRASDNACPINAVTLRSFRVVVSYDAEVKHKIIDLRCGNYSVHSVTAPNFMGTPVYSWRIMDDTGRFIIDSSVAVFHSNGKTLSNNQQDTIRFMLPGTYIIQHSIINLPYNCPTIYNDTLIVPPSIAVSLVDTFVCAETLLRLQPTIENGTAPFKFQWGTPNINNPADTFSYFDVLLINGKQDSSFSVLITDKNNCKATDTVRVYLKPAPYVDLGIDAGLCAYDTITIGPSIDFAYWDDPRDEVNETNRLGDTLWVEWHYNGSFLQTNRKLTTNKNGTYSLKVTEDGVGCSATDTLRIFLKPMPFVDLGQDVRICSYNSISLNPTDSLTYLDDPRTQTERYKDTVLMEWEHNGIFLQSTRNLKTAIAGKYTLNLTEGQQGCAFSDSVNLFVNDTVKASAGPDQTKKWNDTLTLVASGFDSLAPNKTGEYRWWDISTTPGTPINKGTTAKVQFQITRTSNYQVELFVTEDTTTCFDADIVHVKVDSTGGISLNDQKTEQISIWPNPLSNDLVLNFTILGEKPVSVLIWDVAGKLVAAKNEIYSETGTMALEAMPAGFYIVEVRSIHSGRFEKLVVQ